MTSGGKQHLLLGGEMNRDFLAEMLLDLSLPCLEIAVRDGLRAIDADAQGQRALVLVR
jgi:hypothetical protein